MLFFILASFLLKLTQAIPQNLEIDVIKVKLYREELPYPPFFNGLQIFESKIDEELLYYSIENISMPVFNSIDKKTLTAVSETRILLESEDYGWIKNEKGKIMPPWNPREVTREYLKVLSEKDMKNLLNASQVNYHGKIKIGERKRYYDLQFSFNTEMNLLIDASCENCSKISPEYLYSCEDELSCLILESNTQLNEGKFEGDICETSIWFKKYEIEEIGIPFKFFSAKNVTDKVKYGGLISLSPNSILLDNMMEQTLITRKIYGIHYQSIAFRDDDSFVVVGGREEHYKNEDFEYINFRIVDAKVTFYLEGIIIRKNGVAPKSLYGLQNYKVKLQDSGLFLAFPFNVLEAIKDTFSSMQIHCYIDAELSPGILICNQKKSSFPIISLIIEGREVAIDPSIYAGTCEDHSEVILCFTRLAVSFDNSIELGEPFFMNYFVLIDLENQKLGLSFPKSQQIVDWSIFDNTIVLLILLILFGIIIIGGIVCIRRRSERRRKAFNSLVEENKDKPINIEMKK